MVKITVAVRQESFPKQAKRVKIRLSIPRVEPRWASMTRDTSKGREQGTTRVCPADSQQGGDAVDGMMHDASLSLSAPGAAYAGIDRQDYGYLGTGPGAKTHLGIPHALW